MLNHYVLFLLISLPYEFLILFVYLNQSLTDAIDNLNESGKPLTRKILLEAVTEGAVLRVRPIMMTVLTVVIGLVPIMLNDGTGSEVMQRIAGPMIGGMISTVFLSLLVIPVIFFTWKQAGITKEKDS